VLFNSAEFIFGFLPLTLIGFYLLDSRSRPWALRWLILASLGFYAWWRPLNVLIIAPSILINLIAAEILQRLSANDQRRGLARVVLILGIAFNVCFLGYFKYTDFFLGAVNDTVGTHFVLLHIVLPLGISFITFQKIAFLVDVYSGRIKSFTIQDYCLFVLFFPQLIAGPIVHYREVMPQFNTPARQVNKENLAVGFTMFFFGLFKKVVLADNIAAQVTPLYDQAAAGSHASLLVAWMAALGFTLQLYFDFSGYTDMALGLGRLFGVRLPPNFNSPLKATSIIDFWLRWHMTLTRFLTAYIYNPLTLWLTRRRAAKGKPGMSGRNTTLATFLQLLAFPTLLTMFISGLWHGAGYLFVMWGLVHGVYLTINHGWRLIAARLWTNRQRYTRIMKPIGGVATFIAVVAAMVLFRSTTVGAAASLLKGMVGLSGITLPAALQTHLGPLKALVASDGTSLSDLAVLFAWIIPALLIALILPNTLQIVARYEPALGVKPSPLPGWLLERMLKWRPSLTWAVAMSIIAAIGVYSLGGPSEFLYWQF